MSTWKPAGARRTGHSRPSDPPLRELRRVREIAHIRYDGDGRRQAVRERRFGRHRHRGRGCGARQVLSVVPTSDTTWATCGQDDPRRGWWSLRRRLAQRARIGAGLRRRRIQHAHRGKIERHPGGHRDDHQGPLGPLHGRTSLGSVGLSARPRTAPRRVGDRPHRAVRRRPVVRGRVLLPKTTVRRREPTPPRAAPILGRGPPEEGTSLGPRIPGIHGGKMICADSTASGACAGGSTGRGSTGRPDGHLVAPAR